MRATLAGLLILAPVGLSGCLTFDEAAEPERFMGFTCQQLADMAESFRASPQDLLQEPELSELGRDPAGNEIGQAIFQDDTSLNRDLKRDLRSIALARREKGCA